MSRLKSRPVRREEGSAVVCVAEGLEGGGGL